jgi:hypothetical protein
MSAIQGAARAALAKSDLSLQQISGAADSVALVSLVLAAGGDMRIWPDPVSGRNRYGTLAKPAPGEISFSSTTASNVSSEGFAAADRALQRLFGKTPEAARPPEQWFDDIREQLLRLLGLPDAAVVFAASGTDTEVLALGIAVGLATRPLTNIFMAPDETGNGVPLAASGQHFSDSTAIGETVATGEPIEGFGVDDLAVRSVPIRDETGAPRNAAAVDLEVAAAVEQELRRGRDVLLHVLDTSKTGLAGVTRATARSLAAAAGGRVRVVIDACQLRCSLAQLRKDLADGFIVMVTGSKFAGGPPFSGALLLPAAVADEIAARGDFPAGLADYSAALDWPQALREHLNIQFKSDANIGAGLRWAAALDHIASYAAAGELRQKPIIDHFSRAVRSRASGVEGILLHDDDAEDRLASRSIVPLTVLTPDGAFASMDEARHLQLALRDVYDGPTCHIGQPVRVGPRTVLRVSASDKDVADVAARMAAGQSLEKAFAPIDANLDAFFAKWSKIFSLLKCGVTSSG